MSHLLCLARTPFDLGVFRAVARQPLRRTLAYLALLIALSTIATTVSLTLMLREWVRRLEPHLDELPTITIRDGEASADVEQPWLRRLGRDDQGHDLVVIIDTTGTRDDFGPNELGLFLKKSEVIVKSPEQVRSFSLASVPDLTIGPAVARRFIDHWMRRVPLYLALVLFSVYVVVKTTQALLLVLAALIGAARRPLPFGALFTVAVYALTLPVLLDCVLPLVPIRVPLFFAIYGALAIVYAILGAQRAVAEPPADASS
jgi:hypothetical protein